MICDLCGNENEKLTTYNDHQICDGCRVKVDDYANRVSTRLERMQKRADHAAQESANDWERAHNMAQAIPFGQPILVGHHSESRDRNYRNKIENLQRRGYEKYKKAETLARRASSAEHNCAISSDDPAAVIKLQEKLAKLQAAQGQMVMINKAVRKLVPHVERMSVTGHHGTTDEINARFKTEKERVQAIVSEYVKLAPDLAKMAGISEALAVKLLTPDMVSDIGIPAYALKNNGAEIRRCLKRIDELQAQRTTVAENARESVYGDIRLTRDADDNRLRLHFPGKPSREVIAILKQHGFKWSPTNTAWQRQLNASAEYAAQQVIRLINPSLE